MKVAVLFDNFGPYHLARLRAAALVTDLLAVEVAASSAEYAWKHLGENAETLKPEILKSGNNFSMSACQYVSISAFKTATLLERGTSRQVSSHELAARLNRVLDVFQPQVVFIPGWSSKAAFAALRWCARNKTPVVAMSESTEWDDTRSAWREAVKRRIVGLCSAAIVGGTPHRDYMAKLGMPVERIFLGYDAVDNGYFKENAEKLKTEILKKEIRKKYGLPENYFLASARFVEKKNLPRLLQAYARYRELAAKAENRKQKAENTSPQPPPQSGEGETPWNLVLLGDGALRETLNFQLSTLNLHGHVQMPGFKQYPELPAYYGCANAFIHASTTEQWGLVVNEAMASGLPVLVSNRCGCAWDLVQDGVNGFTFDPYNIEEMANAMMQVWSMEYGAAARGQTTDDGGRKAENGNTSTTLAEMGDASRQIIADWGTECFSGGLNAAAGKALEVGPIKPTTLQRVILNLVPHR